ncbi:coiled-coil domain-containing protein 22 homolog [Condylostylus longicornis]|uniref:coiled-coil domain-containing protein 22 homolog n=1 Tax=Condylostylus longicornis TaxID=2530218 RepID=UPI00244E3B20|nr:coiled-coil domain-containing protein 22 homolog [Condylostylus longicornis]
MDEVDNIIIHSLKQIGCNIDDDVISLSSFSPELLVETVSKCLQLIKPSSNLPKNLPSNMAQRFSVSSTLAEAVQSVGFRGDIGYQTFLYSNVTEVRRVFMFLIERLPKETEKMPISTQPLDKLTQIEHEIYYNMRIQLNSPWVPSYCNKYGIRHFNTKIYSLNSSGAKFKPQLNINIPNQLDKTKEVIPPELSNYWLKRSPNIFQQTNILNICPTVIHKNDLDCYYDKNENSVNVYDRTEELLQKIISKRKNYVIPQKINTTSENLIDNKLTIHKTQSDSKLLKQQASTSKMVQSSSSSPSSTHKVLNNNQKENVNLIKPYSPLESLNLDVEKLKKSIDDLLAKRKEIQQELTQMKQVRVEHEAQLSEIQSERKIKERSNILLENPDVNIAKMESIIAATNERLKKLQLQWEEHRKPLVAALEKSRAKNANVNSQVMDQIRNIRDKQSELAEDLKLKSTLHSQLVVQLANIDKTVSRNAYTTRILEIVGNIRKQKNDIDKVLRDTRELQKQINNISGQLDRQFTVTDDLLFKTAKRDEYSKKAYKLLATLHSDCSELVRLVQETGSVMREVRDLEDQIENEKSRNVSNNLEKITYDIKQMEKYSKDLQEQIRKVENQITQG